MFGDFLSPPYDSYHPDYSLTLVNSLRSYLNSKLDHELKTSEFITEFRRRLYFIHEYNCHVAKITHEYPQARKFELLLVRYVELEFDVLYSKNSRPAREFERETELRVLRLLQVMLYPTILNNEPLVNKHTDTILKKSVLELLRGVKSNYLVKNKLVWNIANKLLKKVDRKNKRFYFTQPSRRNLATSDYGTDSDSDLDHGDCVEVPVTTNGVAPVPTIEFTDDDDYLVYLQKRSPSKRKINPPTIVCDEDEPTSKKAPGVVTFEILDDDDDDNQTNYMVYLQKEVKTNTKRRKEKIEVIVCSDSEDESGEVSRTDDSEGVVPSTSTKGSEETEVSDAIYDDIFGGPVLCEKSEDFETLTTTSDCRINESFLEELLLDDSCKEFEELEYFLFNDNNNCLSNFSFDSETVLQPETFDADIKSLESFLDDSKLIETDDSLDFLKNSR